MMFKQPTIVNLEGSSMKHTVCEYLIFGAAGVLLLQYHLEGTS